MPGAEQRSRHTLGTQIIPPELLTFDAEGNTLAEVASAIMGLEEAGKAEWWVQVRHHEAGGRVTAAAVTVTQRMTVPRWPHYAHASHSVRQEWDRFWAALEDHQMGHFALVGEHLAALDQQLIGQPARYVQDIVDRALASLVWASQGYDQSTDHGRKQGAVINLGVEARVSARD